MDVDTLVLGDLGELFTLDLGGRVLAAAIEPSDPTLGSPRGLEHHAEVGLPPDLPYFNAGVLVIDLDRWRADEVGVRAVEHVRRWAPDRMDQDALNVAVA